MQALQLEGHTLRPRRSSEPAHSFQVLARRLRQVWNAARVCAAIGACQWQGCRAQQGSAASCRAASRTAGLLLFGTLHVCCALGPPIGGGQHAGSGCAGRPGLGSTLPYARSLAASVHGLLCLGSDHISAMADNLLSPCRGDVLLTRSHVRSIAYSKAGNASGLLDKTMTSL